MKDHVIYGDEDQEFLFDLFSQQDEIQRLVDISNRKIMKERLKGKKRIEKELINTTVNAVKPAEIPEDVKEGKPEKKKKENKEEKKKETKKLNEGALIKLLILFLVLVGVIIAFQFKDELAEIGKNTVNTISETTGDTLNEASFFDKFTDKIKGIFDSGKTSGDSAGNTEGTSGEVSANDAGYLSNAEEKEYSIKEVLYAASDANTALRNYYDTLVTIAQNSKTSDVKEMIMSNISMVESDKEAFATYEQAFIGYNGGTRYYQSIYDRFENLEDLLNTIKWVENAKIYEYINEAIEEENENIVQDKSSLTNFLEVNEIPYTDNGSTVVFEAE